MISCILDKIAVLVPQIILVYFNLYAIRLEDEFTLAKGTGLFL
jgi:hypothetical protein